MKFSTKLGLFFLVIFLSTFAFAAKTIPPKDPILTPINGLTINSKPGVITLVNNTGKDIPVTKMLLIFNLDQNAIPSLWGSPWLNWMAAPKAIKKIVHEVKAYEFVNQANLPNKIFRSGDTITVNYSPDPWNNPNAPKDIQLFSVVYPLNPATITSTVTSSGGVNTVSITNASDQAISLDGAQLKLDYQGQIESSIWGTPWGNWTVMQGAPNYVINSGTNNSIPPRGVLTVVFNGNNSPITNIQLWVQGVQPPVTGEINVNFPATPVGVTVNPQVTLKGPSFPNGQTIIGTWGQTLVQKNLQAGSYTLSAPELNTPTAIYSATINPNPAVVIGATPVQVSLLYTQKQLGKLNIQMNPAPALGIANPVLKITGPEFPTGMTITGKWGDDFFVCPGGEPSCPGIKAGDYTITASTVYSSTDAYIPANLSNPVKVTVNQTTELPLSYSEVAKGSFTTTITFPTSQKLKLSEQTYQINFVNQSGNLFSKVLNLGANTVSLPIDDTYAITAPNISGFTATVNPTSISVIQSGTPNVSIQYKAGAAGKFVVYYGGWEGLLYNLNNLPSTVTALNLSFANITSSLQVDTAPSGWLTNIPLANSRLQPSYINWTNFKYNRPNTKVLLAVGGATYSHIWNNLLTPNTADTIAKNIAAVVNQPYPIYRGEFAYQAELLGNVTIDGVDLDIETGGRLSTTVANNVILLTQNLKKYLNPGKIITFAGFSVGADPNDSRCTVQGSVHCGEDIPLLQSLGSTFEWVNVMAYDAGQDYANSKYQIALANYAGYIGKSKTLLGLDVQNQWPGFSETAAQLAVKAAWQKQNGYGGVMFWGVGVENNPTKEQQYVNAINAAIQ